MTLEFGKYRGCDIRDVPIEYLEWLLSQTQKTISEIENELKMREMEEQEDASWLERIIKVGYKTLSKQHHPDIGGNAEDMKELNAAYALLSERLGYRK